MGKTFFLDHFYKYLEEKKHLVISINAWKDDASDEPFISVLAAFDKAFQPFIKKGGSFQNNWNSVKKNAGKIAIKVGAGVVKTFFKKHVGDSEELFSELSEPIAVGGEAAIESIGVEVDQLIDKQTQNLIDKFNERKDDEQKFRNNLKTVINLISGVEESQKLPIFVMVDELDRCRPSYAIALLERVKHFFDVPNLIFVFATNSNQLQHAVAGVYGTNFDGFNYLNRFFDRRYSLTITDQMDYIRSWSKKFNNMAFQQNYRQETTKFIASFKLDLRALAKLFDLLETTIILTKKSDFIEIVLLTMLCVQYLKTGDCNWKKASEIVPDNLNFIFTQGNEKSAAENMHTFLNEFDRILKLNDNDLVKVKLDDNHTIENLISRILNARGKFNYYDIDEIAAYYRNLPDIIKSAGKFAT